MRLSEQAGSAALHQRLWAFGSLVKVLIAFGTAPVTAVALALVVTVVLAKV